MENKKLSYLSCEEKIGYHMHRILHLKEFGYSFPAHLTIGLVTYCDQFCKGCYAGGYRFNPKIMSTASLRALKNILSTAAFFGSEYESSGHPHYCKNNLGLKAVTLVGSGEPLLYPHLVEFVKFMKKDLNLEIGAYTNGSNLHDAVIRPNIDETPQDIASLVLENFRFIRISLDAASAQTHYKERGVKDQFDKIIKNISQLVDRRNQMRAVEPTIGIQFTVDDHNRHEIVDIARLSKKLKVDYLAFKPKYVPWYIKDRDRMTELKLEDISSQLEEAQKLADDTFDVHGKLQQFKLAWAEQRNNCAENYSLCLGCWLSSYIDVDVRSPDQDHSDMRVFLCVNKDKEEVGANDEFLWSVGPVTAQTDFYQFWKEKMPAMVRRIRVTQCVSGCKNDPYNSILSDLLSKEVEQIASMCKSADNAPPQLHVNHV